MTEVEFGLPIATTSRVREIFEAHQEIDRAIIFGSRAMGNFREGSDIDLTLFGKSLTSKHVGRIEDELDDLLLPYSFDLSIFAQIENEDLRTHISRVGRVFYDRLA